MKITSLPVLLCLLFTLFVKGLNANGNDKMPLQTVSLFNATPDPTDGKFLIRAYLPDNDPGASIRILDQDNNVVKEFSLSLETGISSTVINASDWKNGTYTYQLFYKGETKYSKTMVVKH